ncbi:MAG: hypothetical protein ACKVHO_21890 [Verrucomicrobiia bacterium]|jgi:hypothetical protein
MDWVHVHLALNHVPVMGSLFVGLLLITAMWKRSDELIRLSLWWLVALMLISIPIKFTGDFAQEKVVTYEGTDAQMVETHEQAADQATTAIFMAGIFAGIALFLGRKGQPVPKWGMITALVFVLLTFGLMARTANLGGQIRHPEIRDAN